MLYTRSKIDQFDKRFRTQFINSLTGFKSINLIGSKSKEGIENVAPFSQVIHVGAHPPLVGVLFRPGVVERNTLENIREIFYFTLNHITASNFIQGHQTSARYAKEVSEFKATGLKSQYIEDFPAPFIASSKIKVGLKFKEEVTLASNGTHLLVGEIILVDLPEEYLGNDGFIDLEKAGSLTCSGLDSYHKTTVVKRLPYAKVDKPIL